MIHHVLFWHHVMLLCPPLTVSHSENVLRIDEGEASKLCLIQVHDKQFICWRHFRLLAGKLSIKVAYILSGFLKLAKNIVNIAWRVLVTFNTKNWKQWLKRERHKKKLDKAIKRYKLQVNIFKQPYIIDMPFWLIYFKLWIKYWKCIIFEYIPSKFKDFKRLSQTCEQFYRSDIKIK